MTLNGFVALGVFGTVVICIVTAFAKDWYINRKEKKKVKGFDIKWNKIVEQYEKELGKSTKDMTDWEIAALNKRLMDELTVYWGL